MNTSARAVLVTVLLCMMSSSAWSQQADLIPRGATWKYKDDGSDQGTAWRAPNFDDSKWAQGPASLGYGDGDEKTVIKFGPNENDKFVTSYFRLGFEVADPEVYKKYKSLTLQAQCDDGCIAYLNGREVWRTDMPAGEVTFKTYSINAADGARENAYLPGSVDPMLLRKGRNVLAVEVHQQRPTSSDVSFDLQLAGNDAPAPPSPFTVSQRIAPGRELRPLAPELLERVPAELRTLAANIVQMSGDNQRRLVTSEGDSFRASILLALLTAANEADAPTVLNYVERDSSPNVRRNVIINLAAGSAFRNKPWARAVVEKAIVSDPDPKNAESLIQQLYQQSTNPLYQLITQRVQADKQRGDFASLAATSDLQERYRMLLRGTMLPAFLRQAPAAFSLKPASQAVKFVVFGDFGTGSSNQKEVAAAIAAVHRKQPIDLGLTVGDNFYNVGMLSVADDRWKSQWEDLYSGLGIKFYPTLGNHDWGHPDSPAAEILYSLKSPSWHMPAQYYTYTAGPVQFFAIDTVSLSEKQLLWLKDELAKSTSRWKIVYGHYPVYSPGPHGDTKDLVERLWPIIKNKVDVYLAGHDHILTHMRPQDGVEFFIAGGGGASNYQINPKDTRPLFAKSAYGFLTGEATNDEILFRFVGANGEEPYRYTVRKSK